MKLSIVSPVYKAEKMIDELVSRISKVAEQITSEYEIILVEDFSPDNSWLKIEENAIKNPHVKGIKLSRNFGQHHAITAGLDLCKGDWVIVMDCDLQDCPEEIGSLYNKAMEGYDIVFARRANRKDSFMKKQMSKFFYKLFSYLSGVPQDGKIANFGIYSKKVINAINSMREPMRAFSPMARWVGFTKIAIDVKHNERHEGKSSYNFSRLINLALDIALAYSDKPLRMVIKVGFIISSLSILYAFYNLYLYYIGVINVSGFTSLIVSIWFLSGLIIFILGIIGLYIGKTFESAKNRPLYLIDKKTF